MSNQIGFKELQIHPSLLLSEDIVSILGIVSEVILKLVQVGGVCLGNLITGVVVSGVVKVPVKD